ncbi:TraX family protein, partial [Blautia wexlerae]|uniref:TraX family protein n=1 Tax=Blautia wexlerae TaxID=418240 RepID=UPI0034A5712B
LYYEWKACFAFLSINMYNGERGFVKGKFLTYVFYWFYPVHIIILVILRKLLFHM